MKTKTKPDIQKHLEAIAGHKLSADAVERIRFVQAVASSTISDNGVITLRDLIVARPNRCYGTRLLDVSGLRRPGAMGRAGFGLPISFVTPASVLGR